MVELGGYVGYSTILFASHLRATSAAPRYFCLELNPLFGAIIMALVSLAGLSEVVTVVIGPSAVSLRRLHAEGVLRKIDLLFLDHFKPAYVGDLKLCESLGMVAAGCVLAADNVVKPGNPPYLEYVRASVEEKKEAGKRALELGVDDPMGDPMLRYESRMVGSFEPTGIPVCILPFLFLYRGTEVGYRMRLRLRFAWGTEQKFQFTLLVRFCFNQMGVGD